jgi:hypothetical protein
MATLAFTAQSKGDHGGHKASYYIGPLKAVVGAFTFDTSYPDLGYTKATLQALPGLSPYLATIVAIIPLGAAAYSSGQLGFMVGWDGTNGRLQAYSGGAGTIAGLADAATGEDNLDGATVSCIVIGY